jgi:hypothetical protein
MIAPKFGTVSSSLGQEHGANIAERPEPRLGLDHGPDVIAGQGNVLPAERSDMRQEVIGNRDALRPQLRTARPR